MKTDANSPALEGCTRRFVRRRSPRRVGLYEAILSSGEATIIDYHPWAGAENVNTMEAIDMGDVVGWRCIVGQTYETPE
jgi:hypothetical protein